VSRRALVLFGLMSVIWGIPYLFIRIAVAEITPPTLVLWRTLIAAVILLPFALVRTDLRQVLTRWRWVVAFAAVEIAIPWVALGSAEQHISSSLAGLLIAGVPLVGAAIALGTGGADRFGTVGLVGMLVGIAGVALIVGADFGTTDTTALLQMGVVVVGYALGPAILARKLDGLPTVGIMAVSLTLVAIRQPGPPSPAASGMTAAFPSCSTSSSGGITSGGQNSRSSSYRAANTSPRRASMSGSRTRWSMPSASAASDDTRLSGRPAAVASARAVAMPMRSPVNVPGPTPTAIASRSPQSTSARSITSATAGISSAACAGGRPSRSAGGRTSNASPSARSTHALAAGVDVSIPSSVTRR